jgi:hypothetical protein
LAKSPKLAPHIDYDAITTAAGNESIPFRNGSRIVFAARERGAIRGFTKVRRLILDEAQILTEAAMSDLAPTQNQAENPQIVMMGTPPKPTDPGETFTNLRSEAIAGTADGVLYAELSADPDCDIDDETAWEKANPSLHKRTPVKAIRRLRKLLSNAEDFRREALGIWPDDSARSVVDLARWASLVDPVPPKCETVAIAVDVTPDRASAAVAFAGLRPDGLRHLEVVEHGAGTGWIVDLVLEMLGDRPGAPVVIDATGPAGSLIGALDDVGVSVTATSARDMGKACGAFYDAVVNDPATVSHVDQPELTGALAAAKKRPLGDAWAWSRKTTAVDISPLVAVTLALHGLGIAADPPKKRTGKVW